MATTGEISLDIAVNSEVHCVDGRSGKSIAIIVDPIRRTISNIVVDYLNEDYIVPVRNVAVTTPDLIVLNCTRNELRNMRHFTTEEYLDFLLPDYYFEGEYYLLPYVERDLKLTRIFDSIPVGEITIVRGNAVFATDGKVGTVDEFAVEKETGNITHLILREGSLWLKHDVTIPISNIFEVRDNEVYLNINKKDVGALPSIKVKRWWQ